MKKRKKMVKGKRRKEVLGAYSRSQGVLPLAGQA
jgi:hypothetical protein